LLLAGLSVSSSAAVALGLKGARPFTHVSLKGSFAVTAVIIRVDVFDRLVLLGARGGGGTGLLREGCGR